MNFDVHITCKACNARLELVTAPKNHQGHLHFRCNCMPPSGFLCVLLKASLAPTEKA